MSNPGKCKFWKKTMHTCNKISAPQLAACLTKVQQVSIYPEVNITFKYYFIEKKSKKTCINCKPTGLVDLSSGGVNVLNI